MLKWILRADTEKLDQLDCPTKLTKYELTLIREVTDIKSSYSLRPWSPIWNGGAVIHI